MTQNISKHGRTAVQDVTVSIHIQYLYKKENKHQVVTAKSLNKEVLSGHANRKPTAFASFNKAIRRTLRGHQTFHCDPQW